MFSKSNNKTLLIIFGVLLVLTLVFILSKPTAPGKRERSKKLRTEMLDADTSLISRITIIPRGGEKDDVVLFKEGNTWNVEMEDKNYTADPSAIKNLFRELLNMKTERLAANNKDRWKEYEVTDSTASRVKIEGGKKNETIFIGKFSYQQPKTPSPNPYGQQGKMTTFVRKSGEKEVYAVDGFLAMTFNREANDFRNKTVLKSQKSEWTRLNYSYPGDSSFHLVRQEEKWMVDGILADSASVAKYLNDIDLLTSTHFVDEELMKSAAPSHALKIEGNNFPSPIVINAYPADSTNGYVITSSQNKGAYFSGKESDLFNKIFVGRTEFEPEKINDGD